MIIPPWLHDIFLGYGDPGAAHYTGMDPALRLQSVDAKDTFLDADHVVESFPQYEVGDRVGVGEGGRCLEWRFIAALLACTTCHQSLSMLTLSSAPCIKPNLPLLAPSLCHLLGQV